MSYRRPKVFTPVLNSVISYWGVNVKAVHSVDSARYAVIQRFEHESEGSQSLRAQARLEEVLA